MICVAKDSGVLGNEKIISKISFNILVMRMVQME